MKLMMRQLIKAHVRLLIILMSISDLIQFHTNFIILLSN